MTEIETFLEIEKIKKLRVLYSHYFDSNDLESMAALFTDDVICEYGKYGTWVGKEELLNNYKAAHARHDLFHNGSYPYMHIITNQWVELTGPETAEGRCYLFDNVTAEPDKNPLSCWESTTTSTRRWLARGRFTALVSNSSGLGVIWSAVFPEAGCRSSCKHRFLAVSSKHVKLGRTSSQLLQLSIYSLPPNLNHSSLRS